MMKAANDTVGGFIRRTGIIGDVVIGCRAKLNQGRRWMLPKASGASSVMNMESVGKGVVDDKGDRNDTGSSLGDDLDP